VSPTVSTAAKPYFVQTAHLAIRARLVEDVFIIASIPLKNEILRKDLPSLTVIS
jgi:hypothetical protein